MDSRSRNEDHQSSFGRVKSAKGIQPKASPGQPETTSTSYTETNCKGNSINLYPQQQREQQDNDNLIPRSHARSKAKKPPSRLRFGGFGYADEPKNRTISCHISNLKAWRNSFQPKSGHLGLRCYIEAGLVPPISSSSLLELEIGRITVNSKLRHDINFDHELHFRPNLDGDRGKLKVGKAAEFWTALQTELELYEFMLTDVGGEEYRWTRAWEREFRSCRKRVPAMFEALRSIILNMMPSKDKLKVQEVFDTALIMDQIQRRCFDITQFAEWLCRLLKAHCAPVRDHMVDQMAKQMIGGGSQASIEITIEGLKGLFGVLEAMKLDIANHQIRILRPMFIDHTFLFEFHDTENKLRHNKAKFMEALLWYNYTCLKDPTTSICKDPHVSKFIWRLVASLLPASCDQGRQNLPPTFYLDYERLNQIRKQIAFIVSEEVCVVRLKCLLHKFKRTKPEFEAVTLQLRHSIATIMGDSWEDEEGIRNVAAEMARLALSDGSAAPYDNALSNRSSLETVAESGFRWTDLVPETEKQVLTDLQRDRRLYQRQSYALATRLCNHIGELVESHKNLTALGLYGSLVGERKAGKSSKKSTEIVHVEQRQPFQSRFSQICRRLTHIVILHWRVWGPLLYMREDLRVIQKVDTSESLESSESESGGSQPSWAMSASTDEMLCNLPDSTSQSCEN